MRIGTPKLIINTHLKQAGGDYEYRTRIMINDIRIIKEKFVNKDRLFIDMNLLYKED